MTTDEWELRYVPLDQIRLDGATQPRVELNDEVRREYRDLYKAGKDLSALILFHDDEGNYWLADGFHRRWGAVDAGLVEVLCTVYHGSLDDARWYSYAANQRHGLRRNNDDKAKAVRAALLHPRGVKLSDHQVAEHCGVSHPFVGKVRKALEEAGQLVTVTSRTGADGRTRNVGNIGRKSARGSQKRLAVIADRMEADRLPATVQVEPEPEPDTPVDTDDPQYPPCINCGHTGRDEYGDCSKCHEPAESVDGNVAPVLRVVDADDDEVDQDDDAPVDDEEADPSDWRAVAEEKLLAALEFIDAPDAVRLIEEVIALLFADPDTGPASVGLGVRR